MSKVDDANIDRVFALNLVQISTIYNIVEAKHLTMTKRISALIINLKLIFREKI